MPQWAQSTLNGPTDPLYGTSLGVNPSYATRQSIFDTPSLSGDWSWTPSDTSAGLSAGSAPVASLGLDANGAFSYTPGPRYEPIMTLAANDLTEPGQQRVMSDGGSGTAEPIDIGTLRTSTITAKRLPQSDELSIVSQDPNTGAITWNTGAVSYPIPAPDMSSQPLPPAFGDRIAALSSESAGQAFLRGWSGGYAGVMEGDAPSAALMAGKYLGEGWDSTKQFLYGMTGASAFDAARANWAAGDYADAAVWGAKSVVDAGLTVFGVGALRPATAVADITPLGIVGSDGIPLTSGGAANSATGAALREDLARRAGIPRGLDNVWGASLSDLKASYEMDRWSVADKAPRASSSGNAQVFTVDAPSDGSVVVKQVQFSPASDASVHEGQYYKFSYTDGSTVKVIDPSTYRVTGWPETNTTFYNQTGSRIVYNPATKNWSPQ